MISNNSKKKIIVLQLGARMHYAVPALLDQNKNLISFYTDIHSSHFIFELINFIARKISI